MDLEELKVIISASVEGFENSILKIKEQLGGLNKEVDKVNDSITTKLNNSKINPKIDIESMKKQIDDLTNKIGSKANGVADKVKTQTKGALDSLVSETDKAISKVIDRVKNIKMPTFNFPRIDSIKPNSNDSVNQTTTRGPPKTKGIDAESLKSEITNVTATLDNINERIEREQAKLAQLKESFKNAFNPVVKDGIQDQILKTEASINSLISRSDKLGFKLSDLDAKLASVGNASKSGLSESLKSVGKGAEGATSKFNLLGKFTGLFGNIAKSTANTGKKLSEAIKDMGSSCNSSNKHMSNMHYSLGNIARQFATWMIILPLVMKGIEAMTSGLLADLKTNEQFNNSLNQIKTNLMVAFTPIFYAILPAINSLMSALATATTYIASFISAIFGKTYQQSYQATQGLIDAKNAMGAYGDSAKKASKDALGLAGFDEINKLSKTNSDTGNSKVPTLTQPSIDTSQVDSKMQALADKFKEILGKIFDPMKEAWNAEGKNTMDALKYALGNVWDLAKDIGKTFLDVWDNGTGVRVCTDILKLLQTIFGIVGDIAKAFKIAWDTGGLGKALVQAIFNALDSVLKVLNSIGTTFRDVWNSGVGVEICTSILQILTNVFTIIGQIATSFDNAWQTNGETIVSGILGILNNILSTIATISTNWIKAWNNNGAGDKLLQSILGLLGNIVTTLADVTAGIGDSFGKATETLFPTFINFCTSIGNSLSNITSGFKTIWDNGGQVLFDGIVQLGTQIANLIMQLSSGVFADFSVVFKDVLAPAIGAVFDAIGTVLQKLAEFVEWINSNQPIIDGLRVTVEALMAAWTIGSITNFINMSGGLIGAIVSIGSSLAGTAIAQGAYSIASGIATAATTIWTGVSTAASIATTALGVAIDFLCSPIGLAVIAIAGIIAIGVELYQHWDVVKQKANECWTYVQQQFSDFSQWLDGVFAIDWSTQFGAVGDIMNGVAAIVKDVWTGIKEIFQGIIDFVNGVFTGDWDTAWKGVSEIFQGVFDGLRGIAMAPLNAIIAMINGVISAINGMISGLNSLHIDMPDWLPEIGGKSFSMHIPSIPKVPYLATGGIIDSPTLAMVGEAGKEAVMPLERNTGWIDNLAGQIASKIGGNSSSVSTSSDSGDLVFLLDGEVLGKVAISQLRKMKKQGVNLADII